MPFQLLFIKGPDQGRALDLPAGKKITLGRGEECDLIIHDPRVSRSHCQIEVSGDRVVLADAGSSFGTSMNGRPVDTAEMHEGDIVVLGDTEIRLISAAAPADKTAFSPNREDSDESPTGTGTPLADLAGSSRLNKLVGTTLVRYEIGDPIATGKSGIVFRATDTKYDRPVALKVLWPELAKDEVSVQRFIRAMKTMMPIKHPHIVRIYGAGASGGYCWMAMELIEGESLAGMLDRLGVGGMLDWEAAFRATLHIARALDYADENQIVHRNINPGNILIRSEDRLAKLGDLMLAKAMEGTMAESITRAGELIGDLAYMSPEQTRVDGEIDCRSDIYCLGATAYRLVTGKTPFEKSNFSAMIQAIQNETPPPPTKFQLSIPSHFEGIISKMLARAPENRYANPAILVRELEKVAKYQDITDL